MKKVLFIYILISLSTCFFTKAQFKISTDNKIGILTNPSSSFVTIKKNSDTYSKIFAAIDSTFTISNFNRREGDRGWIYGAYGVARPISTNKYSIGIYGNSVAPRSYLVRTASGIYAMAGNATSGWNYGAYAGLGGENKGTAIFAISVLNSDMIPPELLSLNSRYAGFFYGPVNVTETITASDFLVYSDKRLKKDISNIDRNKGLNQLNKLTPVEYRLRNKSQYMMNSSYTRTISNYDEEIENTKRTYFGLIAQEVEKIYPDLVYEKGDGYKSIDYIGLISILIQAVQELNDEIQNYKRTNNMK